MVDTAMARPSARPPIRYLVQRLREPERIRAWLAPERAYAAYALAQLDPSLFPQSQWWTAQSSNGRALLAISRGGLGTALVTLGDPEALDVLLGLHSGPRYAFATFRPEHLAVARHHYVLERQEPMVRMSVTVSTFRPAAGEVLRHCSGQAPRLQRSDARVVNRLYSAEGGTGTYSPRHLASIAGTHVVSNSEGIAVVGNVFTHPTYRDRGLASVATSTVTEALLQTCPYVALTVEATNRAALRVYEKLGYREVCTLLETPVRRREFRALLAPWRRLLARWQGRHLGKKMVP
jgi:GNAT superfamily N-acetyltransferase